LSYIETDAEDDEEDQSKPLMSVLGYQEKADVPSLAALTLNETQFVGCNGRLNKEADTCYCFWVVATLQVRTKKC
jgi:prenyltransferase beta subunit